MVTATGNAVLRAYANAVKAVGKNARTGRSLCSAGFIISNGQKKGQRKGYQVFVGVYRWSDKRLASNPLSGGLLTYP